VSVAASALAPLGPIPNPIVTQRSAGEYCGGDSVGGEAVAGTPDPRVLMIGTTRGFMQYSWLADRRGVEQRQLVGLITQRSGVRIPPPLPVPTRETPRSPQWSGLFRVRVCGRRRHSHNAWAVSAIWTGWADALAGIAR
jgi:hypothetical protein